MITSASAPTNTPAPKYYLAVFNGRLQCLKVLESSSTAMLKLYALQNCSGKKLMCLCDKGEQVIWATRGTGGRNYPEVIEEGDPIGSIIKGISSVEEDS